ncbi:hypothetical protein ACO1O0_002767 [Amphichorda felina]
MRRALNARLAAQAAAMKVSANIIVQLIARWHKGPAEFTFDVQQVIEFALYGSFNSQLSNIIQFLLEDWFPTARGTDEDDDLRLPVEDREGGLRKLDEKTKEQLWTPAGGTRLERWRRRLGIRDGVIWRNLFAKLFLDQTIGLVISACVFLTITNVARVPHPTLVIPVIRERLFSLLLAGWHIWPLVALCNFLWVPVRSRVLVAVFVGFGWSIFLSVFAMRK